MGRGTVAAALTASGVAVVSDPATADVHVVVIAEALKPEDRARLVAADRPTVAVLTRPTWRVSATAAPCQGPTDALPPAAR